MWVVGSLLTVHGMWFCVSDQPTANNSLNFECWSYEDLLREAEAAARLFPEHSSSVHQDVSESKRSLVVNDSQSEYNRAESVQVNSLNSAKESTYDRRRVQAHAQTVRLSSSSTPEGLRPFFADVIMSDIHDLGSENTAATARPSPESSLQVREKDFPTDQVSILQPLDMNIFGNVNRVSESWEGMATPVEGIPSKLRHSNSSGTGWDSTHYHRNDNQNDTFAAPKEKASPSRSVDLQLDLKEDFHTDQKRSDEAFLMSKVDELSQRSQRLSNDILNFEPGPVASAMARNLRLQHIEWEYRLNWFSEIRDRMAVTSKDQQSPSKTTLRYG